MASSGPPPPSNLTAGMESPQDQGPGTPISSSLSFPLARRDHAPGSARWAQSGVQARRLSSTGRCEHVDATDPAISDENMEPPRSTKALVDPSASSSTFVNSKPNLDPSFQAVVDPFTGALSNNPTPLGLGPPPWPTIPTERIPNFGLDHSDEPASPSSLSAQNLHLPHLPPWSTKPSTSAENGHLHIPSPASPDDDAPRIPVPGRPSRHNVPGRPDNESWRTVSSSYDGEPFSSVPSQISDSMTLDNHENSRYFPPRLITSRPFSAAHNSSNAIGKIKSWIGNQEKSRAAKRPQGHPREADDFYRDDTQSSSGESTSDDAFEHNIAALWRQLKERRHRIKQFKDSMAEKRLELRSLRPRMYEADNAFMSSIRPTLVNKGTVNQPMDLVERQFTEVQRLRTECQDLETSYEELEEIVSREETQLYRVEVRFFSLLGSGGDMDSRADSAAALDHKFDSDTDNVPNELRGISPSRPIEDLHPLFVQLTLALASLRNGREELSNLLNMKDQCDETALLKAGLRQKIPKEINEFLADFPTREASMREEITQSEQEVRYFRQLCEEKDVMAKHPSLETISMLSPQLDLEDIGLGDDALILSKPVTLAHRDFSELLSQPDHLLENPVPLTIGESLENAKRMPDDDPEKQPKMQLARKEVAIDNLVKDRARSGGTAQFINRWILHSLRNSPLDVVMLYNVFKSRLSIKNLVLWQRDVLRFWHKDDTWAEIDGYGHDGSETYAIVGTPPRSRAASEGAGSRRLAQPHRRARSSGAVISRAP